MTRSVAILRHVCFHLHLHFYSLLCKAVLNSILSSAVMMMMMMMMMMMAMTICE